MNKLFLKTLVISSMAISAFTYSSYAANDSKHPCPESDGRHPCPKPTKEPKPAKEPKSIVSDKDKHPCPESDGRHPCPKPTKEPKPSTDTPKN